MKKYLVIYQANFICNAKDADAAIDKCEKKFTDCQLIDWQVYDKENKRWVEEE